MIADRTTREQHRGKLLQTYHKEFVGTLEREGFLGKAPTLLDFQVELLKNGVLGKATYS